MTMRQTNDSVESCASATMICALGFFMHLLLSAPTLNMLGYPYGSESASTLFKIHPGNFFILLSFLVLIFSTGNPVERLIRIARQHTAFFSMLMIYIAILIYWILRGPKGVGVILDTHIVLPVCLLVFSYAPLAWCRRIVIGFVAFATLNSVIGIVESSTHLRLLPFDSDWEVLKQAYFRASALMGHPLINASFTAVSVFVVLALRMNVAVKSVIFMILLLSLVGFGGRSGLGICIIGLAILGIKQTWGAFTGGRLSTLQLLLAILALVIVPMICAGALYGVLHSGMGERLMAYSSMEDESAHVRMVSWRAFDALSPAEFMLGIDGDRVAEIGHNLGVVDPTSDIENPWILMFLFLGAFMFALWFLGLGATMGRVMIGASPALIFSLIAYFIIASTSNSFGRKDPVFMLLPGIIVCIKRLQLLGNIKLSETRP